MKTSNNPFMHPFLRGFYFSLEDLPLDYSVFRETDSFISEFVRASSVDVQRFLTANNEVLASYAASRLEKQNDLRIEDIRQIRHGLDEGMLIEKDADAVTELDKKGHDTQESRNIIETFRWASYDGNITAGNLSVELLSQIHEMLCRRIDLYSALFHNNNPYLPGQLRSHDHIRIENYSPVSHTEVRPLLDEIIGFYRQAPSIVNLFLFTSALYAIHPFHNGNKRICRMLEHALLRDLGLNGGNTYSPMRYYYKELDRFRAHLVESLEGRSFLKLVRFGMEALFYQQIEMLGFAVERERAEMVSSFSRKRHLNVKAREMLKLLQKRRAFTTEELARKTRIPERTCREYLKKALDADLITKTVFGKKVFYELRLRRYSRLQEVGSSLIDRYAEAIGYLPLKIDMLFRPRPVS